MTDPERKKLTRRQVSALKALKYIHDKCFARCSAKFIGANNATACRATLEPLGYVKVTRQTFHNGFMYELTPAGRKALEPKP
jgi:hypothetical protein